MGGYAEELGISVAKETIEKGIIWNNVESFNIIDGKEEYKAYYEAILDFAPDFIGGKYLMKTSILKNRRKSIISKILIIIIWILLSYFIDNEIIFPRIGSTLNSLIDIVKSPPKFLNIVWYSLLRSIVGFAISLFLAIIMGGSFLASLRLYII